MYYNMIRTKLSSLLPFSLSFLSISPEIESTQLQEGQELLKLPSILKLVFLNFIHTQFFPRVYTKLSHFLIFLWRYQWRRKRRLWQSLSFNWKVNSCFINTLYPTCTFCGLHCSWLNRKHSEQLIQGASWNCLLLELNCCYSVPLLFHLCTWQRCYCIQIYCWKVHSYIYCDDRITRMT